MGELERMIPGSQCDLWPRRIAFAWFTEREHVPVRLSGPKLFGILSGVFHNGLGRGNGPGVLRSRDGADDETILKGAYRSHSCELGRKAYPRLTERSNLSLFCLAEAAAVWPDTKSVIDAVAPTAPEMRRPPRPDLLVYDESSAPVRLLRSIEELTA
jgi:hypothetical protein